MTYEILPCSQWLAKSRGNLLKLLRVAEVAERRWMQEAAVMLAESKQGLARLQTDA